MDAPKLEILTRHLCRPRRCGLLLRQQASLRALKSDDWTQTLLVDHHMRGWGWTHEWLRRVEPWGQFVWVLDDDNVCSNPDLLSLIDPSVDLHVFGMRYVQTGLVLPPPQHMLAQEAHRNCIGSANVIVSRDLWMAARDAWTQEYSGDFDFIAAAAAKAQKALWVPRIIADIDQENRGAA